MGKCTLVAGEGGLGKSMVLSWIAATVSRGGEWPCQEGQPPCGSIIILSAEDDAADTIVPRLMAADATRGSIAVNNRVLTFVLLAAIITVLALRHYGSPVALRHYGSPAPLPQT